MAGEQTKKRGSRKRGRPPKFDSETAYELLVDEGVRRLRQAGYEPGLGSVSLDQAIGATAVPRGAAYRLWSAEDTAPQEQYRTAVLLRMFDAEVADGVLRELDQVVEEAVAAAQEHMESEDEQRRLFAARTLIRTISSGLQHAVRSSDAFRMSRSLARAADGTLNVPSEVIDAMARAERKVIDHYVAVTAQIFERFDAGVRAPFTYQHIIDLVNALNDGLLVPRPGFESTTVARPTGLNGELEEWSLFAVGYEAIIAFFTTDPILRKAIEKDL